MMRQAGKAFRSFQSESQRALTDLRQAVDASDLKAEFETPLVADEAVPVTIEPEPKPKPVRKAPGKKTPAKAKATAAKKKAARAKNAAEPPPLNPSLPAAYPSLEDT